MIIGMEFRDTGIKNMDFRNIELGNPGCGGTQYEFALLAHHLIELNKGYEIVFFHFSDNIFEPGIKNVKLKNMSEIPLAAKKEKIDILLFWATHDAEWYNNIEELNVTSIAWAHNFLSYPELKMIASNSMVKQLVAVSKEQHELMSGEDAFFKSTYISNMLDFHPAQHDRKLVIEENIVCCIGTLIKAKGFHILAKQWKKILQKVPSAKLYVIGNGNLYDKNSKLGELGLADLSYEKKFMKYLKNENGELLESVKFLGNLGIEKTDIFRKSKVGVCNPNGIETFCISALEMEAQGVPVCSKKLNGLIETVDHGITGFLSKTPKGLRKNIIKLLIDDELNTDMSFKAIEHASKFLGDNLIKKWDDLFINIISGNKFDTDIHVKNHLNRFKWLRLAIGRIRKYKFFHFIPTPSYFSYKILKIKRFLVKIRNLIMRNRIMNRKD